MRGCKPVQSGMRTNKVKEEHKHGDQVISALKGRKALLGFVPSLELFVKAFDQIVGNIVLKALNAYVPGAVKNRLDRNIVGRITVGNDRSGRFPLKKGMIALLIAAAVVGIVFVIVMQKGLSAHGTRRILPTMLFPCSWAFGCKLMLAGSAEILLIPIGIFAVTIK